MCPATGVTAEAGHVVPFRERVERGHGQSVNEDRAEILARHRREVEERTHLSTVILVADNTNNSVFQEIFLVAMMLGNKLAKSNSITDA